VRYATFKLEIVTRYATQLTIAQLSIIVTQLLENVYLRTSMMLSVRILSVKYPYAHLKVVPLYPVFALAQILAFSILVL
jgi:hypothetical protein